MSREWWEERVRTWKLRLLAQAGVGVLLAMAIIATLDDPSLFMRIWRPLMIGVWAAALLNSVDGLRIARHGVSLYDAATPPHSVNHGNRVPCSDPDCPICATPDPEGHPK